MGTTFYNIILAALLAVLLLVLSPNLRQLAAVGLCFWLFAICFIVSGIVGIVGGIRLAIAAFPGQDSYIYSAPPSLLTWPFAMSFVSVVTFFILYFVVALSIVRFIEKRHKVELGKPSAVIGVVVSALSPFIMWIFVIRFLK